MAVNIDESAAARNLDLSHFDDASARVLSFVPTASARAPRVCCDVDRERASRLWDHLLEGTLEIVATSVTSTHLVTTMRSSLSPGPWRSPTRREKLILGRVLGGDLQKTVALDLGLAPSTVATDVARVLGKLGLKRPTETIPLPVVVLAQKAMGIADSSRLEIEEGVDVGDSVAIGTPRLDYRNHRKLTPAERDVARLVAEGFTRRDIARERCTSVHTVANQVSAVLGQLRVTGRFALIRAAMTPSEVR